ncbi:hypothetical protein Tco_0566249 [Tanacetum coccineum]
MIDDELTEKELKQVEADDQAIQTILLGLPEEIYVAVDSFESTQESCISQVPKQITTEQMESNMLQCSSNKGIAYSRLHQLYDFLKYNQKEVDDLRAERLARTHDPLALMANSNNPFNYPVFHQDYIPKQIAQPGMNIGQDRQIQIIRGNGRNQFRQLVGQNVRNQNGYNALQNVENQVVQNAVQNPGVQNFGNQNGLIVVLGIANQIPHGQCCLIAQMEEDVDPTPSEVFDLMDAVKDL